MRSRVPADLTLIGMLASVYFIAGKLGLTLAFVHASATAVWPPTGIALAAVLVFGYRVWPGILLGAFLVNITTEGTLATSLGIAVGNTLEGLLGAHLVNRFARGRDAFGRAQDIVRFVALAGLVSTTVAATFGVTSLSIGGFARWSDYRAIWLTWWLGDAVGALIVAPPLLLWSRHSEGRWDPRRLGEALLLLLCLFLVGQTVFDGWLPMRIRNYPLEFVCIPFLVWAAVRFGQRETATAAVVLSALAISGTLRGFGPFARETPNESLLLLQAFLGVMTMMAMVLAAAVAESVRGEEARARLAAIVESSDDAIIGKSLDGRIESWNAGATRLYGYAADDVIGRSVSILAPPDRSEEVPQILARLKRGEHVQPFETIRVTKDGRPIAVSLTISPLTDSRGRILGASTIARDVTERRRVEEVARRAEILRSVMRLANASAHEINNPLAAMVFDLQLLDRERDGDAQVRVRVKRALESVWRIRDIIGRMQHITKLEVATHVGDVPEMLDLKNSAPDADAEIRDKTT
jgi:PAS domain S-box-containing protein